MSVISKNPFASLGEDGDDSPAPAPKVAAPKKAEAAPARAVPGAGKPAAAGDRGGRGGRGGPRGAPRGAYRNEGDRNTGLPSSDGVAEGMETPGGFDGERVAPSRKSNHVRDAHTKGPPGDRPAKNYTSGGHSSPRGGRGGSRVPAGGGERRQFERRSGGLPDSQKKVEHGWGADEGEAELKAEVEGAADAIKEETAPGTPAEGADADGGWGVPDAVPEAAAAETTEAAEPVEPEEVQKSLDEYLAERAAAAVNFGKKESRQVSADTLEGQEFRREAIDEFYSAKEKKDTKSTKTASKKEKIFIPFDGQFATPPGGGDRPDRGQRGERGGRGGAGGERGGRGRGGPRGGARGGRGAAGAGRGGARAAGANLDSNDQKAFPALGA